MLRFTRTKWFTLGLIGGMFLFPLFSEVRGNISWEGIKTRVSEKGRTGWYVVHRHLQESVESAWDAFRNGNPEDPEREETCNQIESTENQLQTEVDIEVDIQ